MLGVILSVFCYVNEVTWAAPKDGLVAGGANLVIRGLEPSALALTSREGRGIGR